MDIKQDWASYFCLVDNKDASIRLNLAFGQMGAISGYKFRTWFSIKLLNPDENGLTTKEEFPKVSEIEDDISEVLEQNGAIMVGALKTNGTMDLYFYSKNVDNYKELMNSVMKNHKDYLYATDFKEDGEWEDYFNFLYPNEYEMHTIQNGKVLRNLAENGDNPEKKRQVDHWIYFNSQNGRENFVKSVEKLGYEVLSQNKVDGEDYSFELHIARNDNTIWNEVNNYVWELVTLAKENDGIYDGWGCPIEK